MNKGRQLHIPSDAHYQQVYLNENGEYMTVTYHNVDGKVLEQHDLKVSSYEK